MTQSLYVPGIDPAKQKFTASLIAGDGREVWKPRDYLMTREGFDKMAKDLSAVVGPSGRLVAGVEAAARLDDNLLGWLKCLATPYDKRVIRVHAAQTARFAGPRPIRGKSGALDAHRRIAEFTRVYAERSHDFEENAEAREMARQVDENRRLTQEATAVKNRLHQALVISFPEFTQVFPHPFGAEALAALAEVPTAREAAARRPLSLARVKAGRGARSLGAPRAKRLVELAKTSIASATGSGDAAAVRFLISQLRLIEERRNAIGGQITAFASPASSSFPASARPSGDAAASVADAQAGAAPPTAPSPGQTPLAPPPPGLPEQIRLAAAIPGVGLKGAAALILRSGGLTRFTSPKALTAQLGACPDRVQTGVSKDTSHLTHCCDHRARTTLYLLTQMTCIHNPAFAFHKWRYEHAGLKPIQAICACMNRLSVLIWTLIHRRTPYDLSRALDQIRLHHADLWTLFLQQVAQEKTAKKLAACGKLCEYLKNNMAPICKKKP